MYKIMIRLDEPIFNALIKSAKDENRGTREQAEWFVSEQLRRLGLLPPITTTTKQESVHVHQPV